LAPSEAARPNGERQGEESGLEEEDCNGLSDLLNAKDYSCSQILSELGLQGIAISVLWKRKRVSEGAPACLDF